MLNITPNAMAPLRYQTVNELYTMAIECTGTADLLHSYTLDCKGTPEDFYRLSCGLSLLLRRMKTLTEALDPGAGALRAEVHHVN